MPPNKNARAECGERARKNFGAADGTRTRNNQLGRLGLCQLNYCRVQAKFYQKRRPPKGPSSRDYCWIAGGGGTSPGSLALTWPPTLVVWNISPIMPVAEAMPDSSVGMKIFVALPSAMAFRLST